jgi:hypothetical protein
MNSIVVCRLGNNFYASEQDALSTQQFDRLDCLYL